MSSDFSPGETYHEIKTKHISLFDTENSLETKDSKKRLLKSRKSSQKTGSRATTHNSMVNIITPETTDPKVKFGEKRSPTKGPYKINELLELSAETLKKPPRKVGLSQVFMGSYQFTTKPDIDKDGLKR